MHIYDVMGISKTKFFMKHIRLNDKTGKLLRISLEYSQLEVGTSKPFYEHDFETIHTLLTPTWVTHLWKYWSETEVTMELTDFWVYESQKKMISI